MAGQQNLYEHHFNHGVARVVATQPSARALAAWGFGSRRPSAAQADDGAILSADEPAHVVFSQSGIKKTSSTRMLSYVPTSLFSR